MISSNCQVKSAVRGVSGDDCRGQRTSNLCNRVGRRFSDGCKKKYLLDSTDHRDLVWGTITARELEACEDISCLFFAPPFRPPHFSARTIYRTEIDCIEIGALP